MGSFTYNTFGKIITQVFILIQLLYYNFLHFLYIKFFLNLTQGKNVLNLET